MRGAECGAAASALRVLPVRVLDACAVGPVTHSYLRARSSLPNTLPGNMWHSSDVCGRGGGRGVRAV